MDKYTGKYKRRWRGGKIGKYEVISISGGEIEHGGGK